MTYKAYVDGSYIAGNVGYGAVLLDEDEQPVQEFSGEVHHDTQSRQVAGELVAVMTVLDYCKAHDISAIEIYYDYKGIEHWARGQWKTNTALTTRYASYVQQCPVKIRWRKVKSHSGDQWNDVADQLAKRGAGYDENTPKSARNVPDDRHLLAAIGDAFAAHLNSQGIEANFDSVKNSQYARIIITNGKKRLGFFDLYDTKHRPLDPYLHGFKDNALQQKLIRLWALYKKNL